MAHRRRKTAASCPEAVSERAGKSGGKKPLASSKSGAIVVPPSRATTRSHGANQAFQKAQSARARQKALLSGRPRRARAKWIITLLVIALVIGLSLWTGRIYYQAKNSYDTTTILSRRIQEIYTSDYQEQVQARLNTEKSRRAHGTRNMLIEPNPFGTNTTSLYVYFTTPSPASVSYTVTTPDDPAIPSFTRAAHQGRLYQTSHEFSVVGLVPSTKNKVTFTVAYEDGYKQTQDYTYVMGDKWGTEPIKLSKKTTAKGQAVNTGIEDELGQSLYAVLGTGRQDRDYVSFYDDKGILRAELPMSPNHGRTMIQRGGLLYFVSDYHQICAMNSLGRLVTIVNVPRVYQVNNTFTFDNRGRLLLIASDTSQKDTNNIILTVDPATGSSREYLNFSQILADYRRSTRQTSLAQASKQWGWLQLDSIQYLPGGSLLLSSRETSTILKVTGPTIDYLAGPASLWETTVYSSSLLNKDGNFALVAGQHSVEQMDNGLANAWIAQDSALPRKKDSANEDDRSSPQAGTVPDKNRQTTALTKDQHYLTMFNNNYGYSPTNPDMSWSQAIPGVNKAARGDLTDYRSYFAAYRVDEKAKTFTLVSSFPLPYSPLYSNSQVIPLSQPPTSRSAPLLILANSAQQRTWGIYDPQGNLLESFSMGSGVVYTTAVHRYDFTGFYFQ